MPNDKTEFLHIWEKAIIPVRNTVLAECDPCFQEEASLYFRGDNVAWKDGLENKFHEQRHIFKEQCYGKKEERKGDPLLDSRKVGAVLCQTLCLNKPFGFNLEMADKLAMEKKAHLKSLDYTKWAVNNTFVNYKFAHLVSQNLVYLALLSDLMGENATAEMIEMGKELNAVGRLFRYPTESDCDTMDVNVIVALARDNISGQELNMLLYAMILYQNEMYTRVRLKAIVNRKEDIQ